jgi:cytochrome b
VQRTGEIKVWDLFVRVFHWALVVGFCTAYLAEDEMLGLHVWSGYLVFGLVLLRIVWGMVGSAHARFGDFVYGPGEVVRYVKQVITFNAPRHVGHNPAGGAMIVLLLLNLILISLSGMLLHGAENQAGLLGGFAEALGVASEWGAEALEEVHEFFANLTLLLVVIHVSGVLFDSLLHGENLVRSMFTGRKRS